MTKVLCNFNFACVEDLQMFTSGMVGARIAFEFSAEWDGLTKTAVFKAGDTQRDVLLTEDTVTIPWEVLSAPRNMLIVGVYGMRGAELIIPTIYVRLGRIQQGADLSGDPGMPPTPSILNQAIEAAVSARNSSAASANFAAEAETASDDAEAAKKAAESAKEAAEVSASSAAQSEIAAAQYEFKSGQNADDAAKKAQEATESASAAEAAKIAAEASEAAASEYSLSAYGFSVEAETAASKAAKSAETTELYKRQAENAKTNAGIHEMNAEIAKLAAQEAQAAAEKARDEAGEIFVGEFATKNEAKDYADTAENNAKRYTDETAKPFVVNISLTGGGATADKTLEEIADAVNSGVSVFACGNGAAYFPLSYISDMEAGFSAAEADETGAGSVNTVRIMYDGTVQFSAANIPNSIVAQEHYGEHQRIYIKSGAADGGDGSAEKPLKSVDSFFELLNQTKTDIRAYIAEAGVYSVSKPVVNGCTVHITATVPGVTLKFEKTNEPFVTYNCHFNLAGSSEENMLTLDFGNKTQLPPYGYCYFENSSITLTNVKTLGRIVTYGGAIFATNTNVGSYKFVGTNGRLKNTYISNQEDATTGILLEAGSNLRVYGSLKFSPLSETARSSSSIAVNVVGSRIAFTNASTAEEFEDAEIDAGENGKYYYGLVGSGSVILVGDTNYKALESYGVNGNYNYNRTFVDCLVPMSRGKIAANSDLNEIVVPGTYYVGSDVASTIINSPIATTAFTLDVSATSGRVTQTVCSYSTSVSKSYMRSSNAGIFTEWLRLDDTDVVRAQGAISENTDLNDVKKAGSYYAAGSVAKTLINSPVTTTAFTMTVDIVSNRVTQTICTYSTGDRRAYIRSSNAGLFNDWMRLDNSDVYTKDEIDRFQALQDEEIAKKLDKPINVTVTDDTDLDEFITSGVYAFIGYRTKIDGIYEYHPKNTPDKSYMGWLEVLDVPGKSSVRQIWHRLSSDDNGFKTYVRKKYGSGAWSSWRKNAMEEDIKYTTHTNNFDTSSGSADYVYVDSTADDGGDGTLAKPFKNIDEFFQLLNKGKTDIRAVIKHSGTYTVSTRIFHECTLHISYKPSKEDTGDAVIQRTGNGSWAFYNSHINFSGADESRRLKLAMYDTSGNLSDSPIYTENTAVTFDKVDVLNNFILYGGLAAVDNSSFLTLKCSGIGRFTNTKITNTSPNNVVGIHCYSGANVRLEGTLEFANLSGEGTGSDSAALKFTHARVTLTGVPSIPNKYLYSMKATYTDLMFVSEGDRESYDGVGIKSDIRKSTILDGVVVDFKKLQTACSVTDEHVNQLIEEKMSDAGEEWEFTLEDGTTVKKKVLVSDA